MTNEDDVFYRISMVMNVDPAKIAKIVHDYIERDIGCGTVYDRLNCPKPPIYIGPVKVKSLKEKIDNYKRRKKEMKATSTQNIKNVKDICFSIENNPLERESKLTIVASTNDDIFAFEFEGSDLLKSCKRSGLFTGWEKDQKIRELEEEVSRWKKEAADCLKLRDEAQKEAYKLKKENEKYEEKIKKLEHDDMLDKNAADYWSKEHDILLKKFAKLQVENERIKENLNSQHEMIKELNQKNLELQDENEKPADNVNHPSHYTGIYECIDVMQDVFGDEATNDFCLCNAFKYIWRARKKNGLEDVKKAVWYLNKYIEEAEKDGVRKGEQI